MRVLCVEIFHECSYKDGSTLYVSSFLLTQCPFEGYLFYCTVICKRLGTVTTHPSVLSVGKVLKILWRPKQKNFGLFEVVKKRILVRFLQFFFFNNDNNSNGCDKRNGNNKKMDSKISKNTVSLISKVLSPRTGRLK